MSLPSEIIPIFLSSSAADTGYTIEKSLRFNSADSAYLNRTPSSAGNRKTWTWSGWVKLNNTNNAYLFQARSGKGTSSAVTFQVRDSYLRILFRESSTTYAIFDGNALLRDYSAWYHLMVVLDTTQATDTNRLKIYINGIEETAASVTYPAQDYQSVVNTTISHHTGFQYPNSGSNDYSDFYLADVHFIDGQALAPTDFGEYDDNNNWNPKAYSGTYGTNGFHLDFSDNTSTTTIAEDSSGNNNDFTANNFSVASGADNDSMIDTPTNYEADSGNNGGNYATLNSVSVVGNESNKLRNGNLSWSGTSSGQTSYVSTIASDKFYYEAVFDKSSGNGPLIGVLGTTQTQGDRPGQSDDGYCWRATAGTFFINGSSQGNYGNYNGNGTQIIGVAVDSTAGTLEYFVDGVSRGTATSSLPAGKYFAIVADGGNTSTITDCTVNFGQRPFEYTPPSGFKSLCSTNLPDPTIADGSTAMDVVTYTGNGNTQSISSLGFQPDLVWFKQRSGGSLSGGRVHELIDSVRGVEKALESNDTTVEFTSTGSLTSFNSDGFTIGSEDRVNENNASYVAWTWDAGTTTVSNTDGSITSSVRANASAGFSIVSYTGTGSNATVGHGLNDALGLILIKNRDEAKNWVVGHSALPTGNSLRLNLDDDVDTAATIFNSTDPTSSVFSVGTNISVNGSADNIIAYCFAPVEGYSAFGTYEGTGSSDGPFLYTGMRPRWVIFKRTNSSEKWYIFDSERNPENLVTQQLQAHSSAAEATTTGNAVDFLSNGIKIRGGNPTVNNNGSTYIYACFSEHPFKTARAR